MDSIQRIKFSLILSYRATVSFKCIKVFFYHDDAVRDVFFRDPRVRGFPFLLLHLATSVSLPFERFPLSGRFFSLFLLFGPSTLFYSSVTLVTRNITRYDPKFH